MLVKRARCCTDRCLRAVEEVLARCGLELLNTWACSLSQTVLPLHAGSQHKDTPVVRLQTPQQVCAVHQTPTKPR